MKIYTKQGDAGNTRLCGRGRLPKNNIYCVACGTLDELNAALGLAMTRLTNETMRAQLTQIQAELFLAGTDCVTPTDQKNQIKKQIMATDIERLEKWIDAWSEQLPPLTNFILPGGPHGAAELHVARTVCRRAERVMAKLFAQGEISPETFRYLNRLSDYLFVLARVAAEC